MAIFRLIEVWLRIFIRLIEFTIQLIINLVNFFVILIDVINKSREKTHEIQEEKNDILEDKAKDRHLEISVVYSQIVHLFYNIVQYFRRFSLDTCKKSETFPTPRPKSPQLPQKPNLKSRKYRPHYLFLDFFSHKRLKSKSERRICLYKDDLKIWNNECDQINKDYAKSVAEWEKDKENFYKLQLDHNSRIEKTKILYRQKHPKGILYLGEFALNSIRMPGDFEKKIKVGFDLKSGTYIIDFLIPNMDILPKIKEVYYDKNVDQIIEERYSWHELSNLYEHMVFHLTMGCVYILHRVDTEKMINSFIFNGFIKNKMKNNYVNLPRCILSAKVPRRKLKNKNRYIVPEIIIRDFECRNHWPLAHYKSVRPFFTLTKTDDMES